MTPAVKVMAVAMLAEPASLETILQYRHHEAEWRLEQLARVSAPDAALLCRESRRWLYACARLESLRESCPSPQIPDSLSIVPELVPIDLAWHCFLLFTQDYQDFCQKYLGRFIHHQPLTRLQRESFASLREHNPEAALVSRQQQLRPQLMFLGELFGADILNFWFQELPQRFHFQDHLP